jgi:alpha-ketoglutarate-dependent taurine dioxygenase
MQAEPMQADYITTEYAAGVISSIREHVRSLEVEWADGSISTFHYLWLRDNCPLLLHPSTHHRVAETSELPDDVRPVSVTVANDGALEIRWAHDEHLSRYQPDWLQRYDYSKGARHHRRLVSRWDATSILSVLPEAAYPDIVASDATRAQFLSSFLQYGLGVLHHVPCAEGTVLEVAKGFGELRSTGWGLVFDVISMDNANSLAYTNLPLVTHTDEGYRDPAPTIQLQHFLRADAMGGASTLVDGFAIAEDMRTEHPEYFELLSTTMLDFHFEDATAEHRAQDSTISLNGDGSIRAIRYSNHSASPFLMDPDVMELFYAAYREFGRRRESNRYQLRMHMGAGDLYMVDNYRVLHGRTGFTSGGARHLQSCYIERDELASRLAVLLRDVLP